MAGRHGVAEINGACLCYEMVGAGEPLALIHGFTLDSRAWDEQVAALAARYRVIRHDMRGFGRSDAPTDAYSHARDLKALLEHLGVERAHLMGLSLGGEVAIDFALTYPASVRSLILAAPALGGYRWSREWRQGIKAVMEHAKTDGVAAANDLWLSGPLFAPAREQPAVAARLARMVGDYSGWHWLNANPVRSPDSPAAQRFDQIAAPTLIISGERDLPDFQAIAALLRDQIPQARAAVIPRVGHLTNMEAPAEFNRLVLEFLAGQK